MIAPRPIGVLGGMGPEATILFQQKLLGAVEAADDADHIPLIIDMNPQVPSRIARLIEGRGEDPAPVLAAMVRRLEQAGVAALAMPCNTAHHYAPAITAAASVPFFNMVELSAGLATEISPPSGCVGMLASPAVRLTELYEKAFARRGLKAVWPSNEEGMLQAIRSVKARGPSNEARDMLAAASAELAGAGAMFQLVACTEFSLIADGIGSDLHVVDTLDVLVGAIKDFSFSNRQEGAD